jgi:hypothetical protein
MIYGSVHWETYGYHHDKGSLISTHHNSWLTYSNQKYFNIH